MRWETYICPICGATKTLEAQSYQSTREFEEDLPESVPCVRRSCEGRAVP